MAGSASRITLPPSPPSPPSGPPRGTYFSRRKLMHPAPPSPPLTKISISSTKFIWLGGARSPRMKNHYRGAPRLRRGAPNVGGAWGAPGAPHLIGQDAHVAVASAPLEAD